MKTYDIGIKGGKHMHGKKKEGEKMKKGRGNVRTHVSRCVRMPREERWDLVVFSLF